jgi:hypothetical protein
MTIWAEQQNDVCRRFGARFVESPPNSKLGVALQTLTYRPIHGLRHPPTNETCGWYVWGGDVLSEDVDFFQPLHVSHVAELCSLVVPYLGLGPGWRFLLTADHEDVWFDDSIVHI